MQGIDPKYAFWFGVWTSILLMVASAGTSFFDGALPVWIIPPLVKWCAILGTVNSAILTAASGYSSSARGPMISASPVSTVPPVIKSLIVALAIGLGAALVMNGSAMAQGVKRPLLTGNPVEDIKAVAQPQAAAVHLTGNLSKDVLALKAQLDKVILADLNYASKKAAAANTTGSAVRKQCWDAIIVLKTQLDGAELKDATGAVIPKPDPSIVTDVEDAAEVIDALSTTGPLFTNCAGAAQLARTSTLTLINTVVAGAAAFTAIAPIIP